MNPAYRTWNKKLLNSVENNNRVCKMEVKANLKINSKTPSLLKAKFLKNLSNQTDPYKKTSNF